MLRAGKWLFVLISVALVCGAQVSARVQSDKMIGMVVGRTGSVLHIGVPQPVREGTIFEVKLFEGEPPIAEARVISCTRERPFMALAKVIWGDTLVSVPTGVHAYADVDSVEGVDALQLVILQSDDPDRNRFSIQAGAFYPVDAAVRDATSDYWLSYRLSYTFIRAGRFETVLSGEYSKASGQAIVDGYSLDRTIEVIPLTVMGRMKPVTIGKAHLFVGVALGMYNILTSDSAGIGDIKTNTQEFGQELSMGMESSHGWVVELRYRNIQNSDLNGYLFTVGSRF